MEIKVNNSSINILNSSIKILTFIFAVITLCISLFNITYIKSTVYGDSMFNTLNSGDTVYINRFIHGEKDDIIVSKKPQYFTINEDYIIKRLVATGGDTLRIEYNAEKNQMELYVNELISSTFKLEQGEKLSSITSYVQYLNYVTNMVKSKDTKRISKYSSVIIFDENGKFTNYYTGTINIYDDEIYLMGDNWRASTDSTYYGPISKNNIVGRVDIVTKESSNNILEIIKQVFKVLT